MPTVTKDLQILAALELPLMKDSTLMMTNLTLNYLCYGIVEPFLQEDA